MICPHCNSEIPDGSAFCGYCGNQTAPLAASETVSTVNETPVPVPENNVSFDSVPEPVSETVQQAADQPAVQDLNAAEQVYDNMGQADGAQMPYNEQQSPVPTPVNTAEQVYDDMGQTYGTQMTYNEQQSPVPTSVNTAEQVPQSNAAWFANAADQIPSGSVPVNGAADQTPQYGFQPDAAASAGGAYAAGADNAAFAAQPAVQGAAVKTKKFDFKALLKNKLVWICAGAVVLLTVLIIIIANVASSAGKASNPVKGIYVGFYDDGEPKVWYNGSVIKGMEITDSSSQLAISRDGTKMLLSDGSELMLLDGGKYYGITDDYFSGRRAILSESGAVVYISDGTLFIYSGGKNTKIADLEEPSSCRYAVSPDGRTVAFIETNGEEYDKVNVWNGKNVVDLDEKFAPTYVSNGGKIIYGTDSNGKLTYVKNMKPGSAEKLKPASDIEVLSDDHSKIMFYSNSAYYYFDASMDDAVKISSRSFTLLMPGGYEIFPKNYNSFYATSGSSIYRYYKDGDGYDSERIYSGADEALLSADGKTVLYQDGSDLFKLPISGSSSFFDPEPVVDDVSYSFGSFKCDPNLKHIYYMDYDSDLRYVSSDSKKVGSEVSKFVVSEGGVCVFLNTDGDIYYSDRGRDRVKISGISDDVRDIVYQSGYFLARTSEEYYFSRDGKSFTKMK